MIRCTKCQEQYSYGRSIVHLCEHMTIFNGRVFCSSMREFEWNCNESVNKVKNHKIYPLISKRNILSLAYE